MDSTFETQFTNPSTTWMDNATPQDTAALWKRKWEDFNLHDWLFPIKKQPKQYAILLEALEFCSLFCRLDFFRMRASELPTFLSVRTSTWQKSTNVIFRDGELISPGSANVMGNHLMEEAFDG